MAQRGRSDWERQIAAQQREAERQARDAMRRAKEQEKAQQAAHIARQQRLAETKTAAVAEEVRGLDQVLLAALNRPPTTFENLKVGPSAPPFQPGNLAVPHPAPNWEQHAPAEPLGVGRWFGGMSRYRRDLEAAQARFAAATAAFQQAEAARIQALAAAQTTHDREVQTARARAANYNQDVDARRAGFAGGEPAAVEWFVDQLLRRSAYPKGLPSKWQVAYRPENRDVVVEFELPAQQVVPATREYRYVKTRDAVDPIARPAGEIRQRYARLIACVALRTLHEIFRSTPNDVVEAVVFNGRVTTIDRATGKQARPHLISVQAERSAFDELVLAEVEPAACLKYLNALVSPNPFDLEAVEPFIAFDLKRFRFVDGTEELADLDSRPNLLKLSPTEFEHLVKDLFVAMGAEAWRTVPS